MPVRQLTLYDFLADFIPGLLAMSLLAVLMDALGWISIGPDLGLGLGLLLIVFGYLAGRILHALAGQIEVKKIRGFFDTLVFTHEKIRDSRGWLQDRDPITKEPTFSSAIKNGGDTGHRVGLDTKMEGLLLQRVAERYDGLQETVLREKIDQTERFGYSVLWGESTLYHRYNIMETFYRNLWFVTALFSISYLLFGIVAHFTSNSYILLWSFPLFISSYIFEMRRIQFKRRQIRAYINDLYLYLAESGE